MAGRFFRHHLQTKNLAIMSGIFGLLSNAE